MAVFQKKLPHFAGALNISSLTSALEKEEDESKKLMLMSNLQCSEIFCTIVRKSLPMTFLTFFLLQFIHPRHHLAIWHSFCAQFIMKWQKTERKIIIPSRSVSFVMLTWNERKEEEKNEKNNQLVEGRWEKCGGCVIWISQTGTRNQMNERNESLCFSIHAMSKFARTSDKIAEDS